MDHLTPRQVAAWLADASRPPPMLLDVREPWEFEIARIDGATLVPMSTVSARLADIKALQKQGSANALRGIVCICHHGARSLQVAAFLEQQGLAPVANMTSGIDGWSQHVDVAVPVY